MSKRAILRPNQDPSSKRYQVWEFVRDSGRFVTSADVLAGLPGHKQGTVSSALSEYSDRGAMTKLVGNPNRYRVSPEQVKYMLENTTKSSPDILIMLEEPKIVVPQIETEPPTCAEVNLAIREVLMVSTVPLDAEDLAEKTGISLKYVRSELSYMSTREPHSAPYRFKIKGKNRSKVTYHYMKSRKAWDVWGTRR